MVGKSIFLIFVTDTFIFGILSKAMSVDLKKPPRKWIFFLILKKRIMPELTPVEVLFSKQEVDHVIGYLH